MKYANKNILSSIHIFVKYDVCLDSRKPTNPELTAESYLIIYNT